MAGSAVAICDRRRWLDGETPLLRPEFLQRREDLCRAEIIVLVQLANIGVRDPDHCPVSC